MNPTEHSTEERKPWLMFCLTFADDFAIAGVVIVLILVFDLSLPVWAWVILGLAALAVIILVHCITFSALTRKAHMGKETMIGKTATVTQDCCPAGMVMMEGEYWQASCPENCLEEGDEVEIVAVRGLKLEVRKKDA